MHNAFQIPSCVHDHQRRDFLLFLKPASLTQSHRQSISQCQHRRSRSCRSQAQRASLLRNRTIQSHIRRGRQRRNGCGCPTLVSRFLRDRVGILTRILGNTCSLERSLPRACRRVGGSDDFVPRHRNQRHSQPLDRRQQRQNLLRLPTRGQRQHHVPAHHHPQIPVQRVHRMQIQRRSPRRTQRRGNLARNQPALPHPGNHYASRTAIHQLHCAL